MRYENEVKEFNAAVEAYERKDRRRPAKLPTAKQLRLCTCPPIARLNTEMGARIILFCGGFILYEKDGYSTVFPIREHLAIINGADAILYLDRDEKWRWDYIFSDIGERRLLHNKREREGEVSLDVILATDDRSDNGYASRKMRSFIADPSSDFAGVMIDSMFLREVIKTLNQNDRDLLYLRYEENLTYEEIANIINRSVSSVWKDINRILSIFRRELKK